MSYFQHETTAWVDPYILNKAQAAAIFDDDDDAHMLTKKKLAEMVKRRDKRSIPRVSGAVTLPPPEAVLHPVDFAPSQGAGRGGAVDKNAPQYFTHIAVSNGTFVGVTKNNWIHFFDQTNDIPITSMTMVGHTAAADRSVGQSKIANAAGNAMAPLSAIAAPLGVGTTAPATNYVDAKDVAVRLFLDPMGRHAVVVFQSGVNLMYHIRRTDVDAEGDDPAEKKPKSSKKKKLKDAAKNKDKPQRFDILLTSDVSRVPSFAIESIAWDEQNTYETTTGDVILGSQKHGALVACRLESTGVAAVHHLYTFPSPLNRSPVHSIAMIKETEGTKRFAVLVALENKLFFFRSTRSTLESAFVLSDLQCPDTEAEIAFLANSGGNSGLPLKNFLSLPLAAAFASGNQSGPQAAGTAGKGSVQELVSAPQTSKVVIHSPCRDYTQEHLPTCFSWTYHETLVQGVFLPFADVHEGLGAGPSQSAPAAQGAVTMFRRFDEGRPGKGRDAAGLTAAAATSTPLLRAMRAAFRITAVENMMHLVAACEHALQFDVSAQAPTFGAGAGASFPAGNQTNASPKSLSSFSMKESTAGSDRRSPTRAVPPAATSVYTIPERILRITSTYFYLVVATQTKLYVFVNPALLPMPSVCNPWEVRSRLVLQHSLMLGDKSTLLPAVSAVSYVPGAPSSNAGALKIPPSVPLFYRSPDGCFDVRRDMRYINKLYVCGSRDVLELPLPSLKRQFVAMLLHTVKTQLSSSHSSSSAREQLLKVQISSNTRKCSTAVFAYGLLPPPPPPVMDDLTGASGLLTTRQRGQTTAMKGKSQPTVNRALLDASIRDDTATAVYASFAVMRQYGGSRFPLRGQFRAHALTADTLFHVAQSLSQRQKELQKEVDDAHGEFLFTQKRYLEAAARLGKCSRLGKDYWFTKFAQLADVQPLLLYCLQVVQSLTDAGKTVCGSGSIEASCLSSAAFIVLLDRCTAAAQQRELQTLAAAVDGALPAPVDTATKLRHALESQFKLDAPEQLLQRLLTSNSDLLPWSVVREALFHIASERQVFSVCHAMDQLQALLRYLLAHDRFFDALELVIERSKKEFHESLCYDDDGYVHAGVAAHLWEAYGGVLLQHYPIRMIRHGWIPYGSEIGLDPLRLLPVLSRYDVKKNESNLEADGSATEVRLWLESLQRQKQLEHHRNRSVSLSRGAKVAHVSTTSMSSLSNSILTEASPTERERCSEHIGITYLRHLVTEGYTEKAISNLLLRFLAVSGSDDELVEFVASDKTLELQYALRVCNQYERIPAVIQIYFNLGHLHQAIDLALEHRDVARAKKLVERVRDGTPGAGDMPAAVRQELWKKVVALVATQQFGPKNALHLISESKNDVDVSHVIPHLSDDVMLSEFKAELLENVADFGRLMRSVKEDIEKAKTDVEILRGDVSSTQRGTVRVAASKKCDCCGVPVWSSNNRGPPMFFRGCSHAFHEDCLSEKWRCASHIQSDDDQWRTCFLCSPIALSFLLSEPLGTGGLLSL